VHIQFVLAGLHRVQRGAEVAFEAVAAQLALNPQDRVTLIGSGKPRADRPYHFEHVPLIARERFERWPTVPLLRNNMAYEELTFATRLMLSKASRDADVTVTCGYPFTNWALRARGGSRGRPVQVFVTQNGDWPAYARKSEFRFFSCDGLVCTNPLFYERNRERFPSLLVPNGIDPARFHPGAGDRAALGLPPGGPIVLMVCAAQPSKRVMEGLRAVARVPGVVCVVAGDGPQRDEIDRLGAELMPGRFQRRTFPHHQMDDLYRSASVLLHPTIGEAFGNIYVEAMASGLAVVANDEEVTRWIFDGRALLVDVTSEDGVVAAVSSALKVPDATRAEDARYAAGRFAWATIAKAYRGFFADLLAARDTVAVS
jgi:glycosyltransferase involved in cell wall biosynthesis